MILVYFCSAVWVFRLVCVFVDHSIWFDLIWLWFTIFSVNGLILGCLWLIVNGIKSLWIDKKNELKYLIKSSSKCWIFKHPEHRLHHFCNRYGRLWWTGSFVHRCTATTLYPVEFQMHTINEEQLKWMHRSRNKNESTQSTVYTILILTDIPNF